MNEETAYEQQCYYLYQVGADVSGHFGTDGAEVSGHQCRYVLRTVRHWCRSVLGPKCLGSEVSVHLVGDTNSKHNILM